MCFTLFLSVCSLTLMKSHRTCPSGTFITSKRALYSCKHYGCVRECNICRNLNILELYNCHFLESAWCSWEVSSKREYGVCVMHVKLTAVAPKLCSIFKTSVTSVDFYIRFTLLLLRNGRYSFLFSCQKLKKKTQKWNILTNFNNRMCLVYIMKLISFDFIVMFFPLTNKCSLLHISVLVQEVYPLSSFH